MTDQRQIERAGVVGAGLIGRSWAVVFAASGLEVRLCDNDAARLDDAMHWIDANIVELADVGILEDASVVRQRVRSIATLDAAIDGADWVQECTLEAAEIKAEVFTKLDRLAAPSAVLASSSSGLAPSTFASECSGRSRCLVVHPVNPPHLVPLVEIVPGPWTDVAVVTRAEAFMKRLGQAPIVVRKEIHGFVLNRLQGALLDEAFRLVEGGFATAEDVDRCMVDGLALRWSFMGPFETIDLNSAGGLAEYAEKYRSMYFAMHEDRDYDHPWDPATVERIVQDRRQALPADKLFARQAWRDRRLMELAAARRQVVKEGSS